MNSELKQAIYAEANGSTAVDRARLAQDLVREVYNFVTANVAGGGLDERDSPERASLGKVLDATHVHLDNARTNDDVRREDCVTVGPQGLHAD